MIRIRFTSSTRRWTRLPRIAADCASDRYFCLDPCFWGPWAHQVAQMDRNEVSFQIRTRWFRWLSASKRWMIRSHEISGGIVHRVCSSADTGQQVGRKVTWTTWLLLQVTNIGCSMLIVLCRWLRSTAAV